VTGLDPGRLDLNELTNLYGISKVCLTLTPPCIFQQFPCRPNGSEPTCALLAD